MALYAMRGMEVLLIPTTVTTILAIFPYSCSMISSIDEI